MHTLNWITWNETNVASFLDVAGNPYILLFSLAPLWAKLKIPTGMRQNKALFLKILMIMSVSYWNPAHIPNLVQFSAENHARFILDIILTSNSCVLGMSWAWLAARILSKSYLSWWVFDDFFPTAFFNLGRKSFLRFSGVRLGILLVCIARKFNIYILICSCI